MSSWIASIGIGLLCTILGIINLTGNISSLHSYHRHRVREEDKKEFGKLVGLGTLIAGASLIIFGILSLGSERSELPILLLIGTVELIVGIVAGLGISIFAMFKYNKGIF